MLIIKRWIIYFQKRLSRNKSPQTKWQPVDQCTYDDERKRGVSHISQKRPEHFIYFPK